MPSPVREWDWMTLDELGKDKRAAILAIAARHGVHRVRVFGSFARGDASEDSDVDLLIEAGPRTPPWFPGGLLVDLEEELGRRVDVAEESTLHPLIRDRVLHEAIPL
jgi:predicted nucleotidyltransferase